MSEAGVSETNRGSRVRPRLHQCWVSGAFTGSASAAEGTSTGMGPPALTRRKEAVHAGHTGTKRLRTGWWDGMSVIFPRLSPRAQCCLLERLRDFCLQGTPSGVGRTRAFGVCHGHGPRSCSELTDRCDFSPVTQCSGDGGHGGATGHRWRPGRPAGGGASPVDSWAGKQQPLDGTGDSRDKGVLLRG